MGAEKTEDEISLVDIVAVLLKHRKWLISIVVGALLVAAAGYFVFPSREEAQSKRNPLLEASVALSFNPLVLDVMKDAPEQLAIALKDPVLILQALRTAGFQSFQGLPLPPGGDDSQLLLSIRSAFADNQDLKGRALKPDGQFFSVTVVRPDREMPAVRIEYKDRDEARARAFLAAIVPLANDRFRGSFVPIAQNEVESFEKFLNAKLAALVTVSDLIRGFGTYNGAKSLLSGTAPLVTVQQPPYIVARSTVSRQALEASYLKKALLGFVGVVFLALVGAFVIEAIERIKSDPGAMAKLKAALKHD